MNAPQSDQYDALRKRLEFLDGITRMYGPNTPITQTRGEVYQELLNTSKDPSVVDRVLKEWRDKRRKRIVLSTAAVFVVLAIGVLATRALLSTGHSGGVQVSQYIRNRSSDRVIVFVHGLFGDPLATWTCARQQQYWPSLLMTDKVFDDTDIYVSSYETPYFGNRKSVDDIVSNLYQRFEADGIFSHREVMFVCHSLGGIILQRLLLTYRHHSGRVPFIYFYATPQEGSAAANIGKLFDQDPLLRQLLHGGDYLGNLDKEWAAAGFGCKRYCAYELKETKGVVIVDKLSATRNCELGGMGIDEDHIGISKPCTTNDDAYIALRNVVKQHAASRR